MSRAEEPNVTITGYHLGETERAVKFSIHAVAGEEIDPDVQWFPLSQIKSITRATQGSQRDTLVVKQWIARQKGLVDQ
jgi:hypothetical protein